MQSLTAKALFMAAMHNIMHNINWQLFEPFHGIDVIGDVTVGQVVQKQPVINRVARKQSGSLLIPEANAAE